MIVIASIPLVVTDRALIAPAILKSALLSAGIESSAMDLNAPVIQKINSSAKRASLIKSFLSGTVSEDVVDFYANIVTFCSYEILKKNPKIIALSLFCEQTESFCKWLCADIRQKTSAKIVVGGPSISNTNQKWAKAMQQEGLIDRYFVGDSENEFVDYVNNQLKLVDGPLNPELYYIPDYSDYNLYLYNEPTIPVVDSRGCVQKCEFCDVIEKWPKFSYKTGEQIFNEMLFQLKKFNIFHFDFRSSISNGNQKEFIKLIELISDYNSNKFRSEQISWEGSFIIRSSKNEKMWELIKKSNASLFLGVESLVEHVRWNLGKKFTNADLDWTLEQIKIHGIDAKLLFIAGYPTETKEDYELTKKWFVEHQNYSKFLREINVTRAQVLADTQLYRNKEKYQLEIISGNNWISKQTNITSDERFIYYQELILTAKSAGFSIYESY